MKGRNQRRDPASLLGKPLDQAFGDEQPPAGFVFQSRRGQLDLRRIARVDLQRLVEEADVDTLQDFLENITFSELQVDDLRDHSDAHFLKLFRYEFPRAAPALLPTE